MNFLNNLIPESLIEAFGWMILHSIWQGALIALLLFSALLILNKQSSRVRYLVAVGALLLFSAMSVRTFIDHYDISVKTNIKINSEKEIVNAEPAANSIITNNTITESNLFTEISRYFAEHFPLIVSFYLIGVLFLTLKLSGGYLYSQRIKHYRTTEPEHKFKKIVEDFSNRLNLKQKVNIVESALVKVPATIGHFKPVILFPIGLLNGLSYQQVEAIIAHELAHIKRADYLINLIQSVVEIIFFYHPAVWWFSSIIKEERENICDDLALEVADHPGELARALVFINQFEQTEPNLAMSLIGNKNTLTRRVKRMMGEKKHKSIKSRVYSASLLVLIIVSFGLIACSTANGENYYQDDSKVAYREDSNGSSRYVDTDAIYNEEERTYVIYKRYEGERSKWEVTVDNNEIVSLYKDGNQVSQDEIYKYEDMLLDEIEDTDWEMKKLHEDLADLKEDLQDLKININEDLAEDIRKIVKDVQVEINSDEFRRNMAELRRDLNKMKYDFDFDFDFDWDSDEFRREMKELKRELSNIKVDVDLSGLDEEMRQLKEEMKNLDIDMSELKKEMKVLRNFLHELKEEMVADGVIDYEDDLRELNFEDDGMYVNDKKVPHELYLKYREIYKDHYGEYPDKDSFRMHN